MYSVSDFKFLPISCKGLQRLSSVPLPVMSLSLIMSYDLSNHSIKNITLQNTTQDFSEGRPDSRLLRVIAALGNWPSNTILCNYTCSLWLQSSFLFDLSYCHHVYIVLFPTFYLIADARHYYLLITCWKGNMYVGQQCSALKILKSKGQSHSYQWVSDNVTFWGVLHSLNGINHSGKVEC